MKKYLFIIMAALALVGCEGNGVEQKNELVGKVYNTKESVDDTEYNRLVFKSNTQAEHLTYYKGKNDGVFKKYYTFSDDVITFYNDKDKTDLWDFFVYHETYLDRGGNSPESSYYYLEN